MAKLHIRRTIAFIVIGIIVGFLYMALAPKVYESSLQVVVGPPPPGPGRTYAGTETADVANILNVGQPRNALTELQILRSRSLFFAALQALAEEQRQPEMLNQFERYYSMYDVLGERDSDAVQIRARAYTPEMAVMLANEVYDQYNEQRIASARESTRSTLEYLKGQIETSTVELNKAMQARKDYKEQMAIADLASAITQAQNYETQTQGGIDTVRAQLQSAEGERDKTRQQLAGAKSRIDSESVEQRSFVVAKLENDLADLKRQRATLLGQYLEDHPLVIQVDASIKDVSAQLTQARKTTMIRQSRVDRPDPNRTELERIYNASQIRVNGLTKQLAQLESSGQAHRQRLKDLTGAEQKLAELDRSVLIKEANVRSTTLQYENIKNRSETSVQPASIKFPAMQPLDPVYPDPLIVALLSIVGGAALGLLYSFTVESLRLRIYTSYQLADLTGLPVMASLPKLPGSSIRQLESTLGTSSPRILESIRLLAFSLVAQPQEGCRKLLFTGLDRQTGASSSAAQLAIALGHTGARVILVDADLMGRSTSRIFKAEGQRGLAEALTSEGSLEGLSEALRDTGSPNVKLLPAGISNDRAVKECETKRLGEALSWLESRCDYLVFDTPPCLRHSEAARLASETDEVYLVVSLRISTVPIVSAALDILRQAGAGVVRLVTTEGDRSEEALSREARVSSASKALPS